jgi:CheY-like chemotaxis protein
MSKPEARVLVVDDEPNIVDVITMALRFQGFEVASAATGAEALARATPLTTRSAASRSAATTT